MFHFVANCQEGICMQSVMEMSIQSFIDEVFKLTYLIAETTEVNANAQNQELLLQKGKSIESNCVYICTELIKYLIYCGYSFCHVT